MLAKCANPACSATFRYLHEGELCAIESKAVSFGRKSRADPEYAFNSHTFEYFWLCSSCCRAMRVQVDGVHGVTVVRKRGAPNASVMEESPPMAA
jgi:hypothetical protein